jgi:hypothetical protein
MSLRVGEMLLFEASQSNLAANMQGHFSPSGEMP